MAKKALGKGLMALLDDAVKDEVLSQRSSGEKRTLEKRVEDIAVSRIRPSPGQPREDFSELGDLIASIREKGIIQPLLLRKKEDHFQIIAGERRYRAAKEIKKEKVPAIVLDADEQESLELTIIENIQRKDLNPIEEARGFQNLIDRFGSSHEEISRKVGKDRATVTNALRLLTLPEQVRLDVSRGTISAGHAKLLAGLKEKDEILKWRQRILKELLSVRQLERLLAGKRDRLKKTRPALRSDVFLRDFEEKMEEFFSTKVRIRGTNRKGRIVIEYYSLGDLERIRHAVERAQKRSG